MIYHLREPAWRDPKSDFVPFTWEAKGGHRGIPKSVAAKPLKPAVAVAATAVVMP